LKKTTPFQLYLALKRHTTTSHRTRTQINREHPEQWGELYPHANVDNCILELLIAVCVKNCLTPSVIAVVNVCYYCCQLYVAAKCVCKLLLLNNTKWVPVLGAAQIIISLLTFVNDNGWRCLGTLSVC